MRHGEHPADEPEEDGGIKPIPDELMTELTSNRDPRASATRWARILASPSSPRFTPCASRCSTAMRRTPVLSSI